MKRWSFLPRSRSKVVFILVMASYSLAAGSLVGAIVVALGAQRVPPGVFLRRGYPMLEIVSLILIAPVVESLLLIGIIELLRWVRSPSWFQIVCSATVFTILHVPTSISNAFVVAPACFIMAAAYLVWRRESWTTGFAVIMSIHFLLNLNQAIWIFGYAIRHSNG